ncbi:MAG: Uma2 family endonuclease [Actinomycetales bacterium]
MTVLPWSRPLIREDLAALPDDGHRYELLDGALVVTPSPTGWHQRAVAHLVRQLFDHVPVEMAVLFAPMDVVLSEDTVLQPDILVVPESSIGRVIETVPLLAIEVLSPSTRRIDLMLKRSRYEAAGTAAYLVVDPDEWSIHAWVLDDDGRYAEAGAVRGDEVLHLSQPFELTLAPPPPVGS